MSNYRMFEIGETANRVTVKIVDIQRVVSEYLENIVVHKRKK